MIPYGKETGGSSKDKKDGTLLRASSIDLNIPAVISIGTDTQLICVPRPKSGFLGREHLIVYSSEGMRIRVNGNSTFGRNEGNNLVVNDPYVSREHGRIEYRGRGVYKVQDGQDHRGSTNGTLVAPIQEMTSSKFRIFSDSAQKPFILESEPVNLLLSSLNIVLFKDMSGNYNLMLPWRRTPLKIADATTEFAEVTIGRSSDNTVNVPDAYKTVSRRHAKILVMDGVFVIQDLVSTNGTFLSGSSKSSFDNQKTIVAPGFTNSTKETDKFAKVEVATKKYPVGFAESIGGRSTMEDAHVIIRDLGGKIGRDFFGIYDGHGGKRAADLASVLVHEYLVECLALRMTPKDAIHNAFIASDREMIDEGCMEVGTTAIVSFIEDNNLVVANAGDARAVLDQGGEAIRLSYDHKPYDPQEVARIHKAGGSVVSLKGTHRVNGILAVARALGDGEFGESVTAEPYISVTKLDSNSRKLILACDGVWDVIKDDEAIRLIKNEIDPQKASVILKQEALNRGSKDNISVIVVNLK